MTVLSTRIPDLPPHLAQHFEARFGTELRLPFAWPITAGYIVVETDATGEELARTEERLRAIGKASRDVALAWRSYLAELRRELRKYPDAFARRYWSAPDASEVKLRRWFRIARQQVEIAFHALVRPLFDADRRAFDLERFSRRTTDEVPHAPPAAAERPVHRRGPPALADLSVIPGLAGGGAMA